MDLLLFGALLFIAVVLYALGKVFGTVAFVGIASIVLMASGFLVVIDGMSYDQMNATSVTYNFSSDYFEFANDSVQCHNCTAYSFNDTYNATPPGCCEHDVNTTISGAITEAKTIDYEEKSIDIEWARIVGLTLALVGLVGILDASMSFRRELTERGSLF